jgi:3-dehydroquinate dehydratase/shikimate dehydrogenase
MPLKEEAARRSVLSDDIARRSMAVNTVRIDEAGWRGFNTDGPAALDAIRRHLDPAGMRVAVAGAGGAARAIAVSLQGAGADIVLYGRSRAKHLDFASMLGVASRDFEELPSASWDVFVQATPLGRLGETVLPASALTGRLVLDVVYGTEPTPLVREARRRGLAVVEGLELLVGQAVMQIEVLVGAKPEVATVARAGQAWLASRAAARGGLDGFTPAA